MRFCFFFSLLFLLFFEAFAQKNHKTADCVGIMAGKCITLQEFEQAVQKLLVGSRISAQIARDIVWNMYLYELVFEPEFKKLGISLTKEQQQNLMWGDSTQVHPYVLNDKSFDKEKRKAILKQ